MSGCPMSNPLKFPFARPREDLSQPPKEYAELRKKCPVAPIELFDGNKAVLVTKHGDICQVLESDRVSKDRKQPGFPEISPGAKAAGKQITTPTFVDMDPPEHEKQRSLIEHHFSPQSINALRPTILRIVDSCIDKMLTTERCSSTPLDLIEHFCIPIPSNVIYTMIGIPSKDWEYLSSQSSIRSNGSATAAEASQASDNVLSYLRTLFADLSHESATPHNSIIRTLLKINPVPLETAVQITFLLLVAGNLTVASTIALAVFELSRNPSQRQKFLLDPHGLSHALVEEVTRYHTGAGLQTKRVAKEDMKVGGMTVPKGTGIVAAIASANRDEEVWGDEADKFEMFRRNRTDTEGLGFGVGRHRCIGETLSKVEMGIALARLYERLPELQVVRREEEDGREDVVWSKETKDVGIKRLGVVW